MLLDLNRIGQISLPVSDPDRSEAFYAQVIGQEALPLRRSRLLRLRRRAADAGQGPRSCRPRAARLHLFPLRGHRPDGRRAREARLAFTIRPHLIARMDDHDLWMAFFEDPDGHTLAVMQEAPKGYKLPA
jgi:methylmalonyl-CoA/ethylmalonyl-CoA epimerase